MIKSLYAACAAAALVPAAAVAGGGTIGGTANGMNWTAKSHIIGQDSTATVAWGGNSEYLAPNADGYSGVVQLRMQYATGAFVCSGSLMGDGRIVTAAHCISGGYSSNVNGRDAGLLSTTAYFYSGTGQGDDPLMQIGGAPQEGVTAIAVSGYNTHFGYTGEVVDQNDIAVLTLALAAPSYAKGYDLYTGGGLTGATFNIAGYGLRSDSGGADGYGNGHALEQAVAAKGTTPTITASATHTSAASGPTTTGRARTFSAARRRSIIPTSRISTTEPPPTTPTASSSGFATPGSARARSRSLAAIRADRASSMGKSPR